MTGPSPTRLLAHHTNECLAPLARFGVWRVEAKRRANASYQAISGRNHRTTEDSEGLCPSGDGPLRTAPCCHTAARGWWGDELSIQRSWRRQPRPDHQALAQKV